MCESSLSFFFQVLSWKKVNATGRSRILSIMEFSLRFSGDDARWSTLLSELLARSAENHRKGGKFSFEIGQNEFPMICIGSGSRSDVHHHSHDGTVPRFVLRARRIFRISIDRSLAAEAYKMFDEKSDGTIKVVLKTAFAAVQQTATATRQA